ncbi:hypothetical protein LIER_06441 [Lithospermum erythrorhizon]|uniref:Reverse transcriptase n=1 Tax=Lithospermum erythrorhizon TaxID=34254 RepID=A0AAV3P5X8_LITER
MEKACDRIEWGYLKNVMLTMGFPDKLVSLIMDFITTVSYSVLINEARGEWNEIRIGRNGPMLSHLFFADDSLLFARASIEKCCVIKEVLHRYEQGSRQRVNFAKSAISFSPNVSLEARQQIYAMLGPWGGGGRRT